VTRERLVAAVKSGVVHHTGLIAHGRGEAFDYLLGEQTIPQADAAEKTAAAALVLAKHPVISVNGNVAALSAKDCVRLSQKVPACLEVNLFHRSSQRMNKVASVLRQHGATTVYGLHPDARIPGLNHDRAFCETMGMFTADVVLVPLEDGDRCQALCAMGKTVIVVDLNPLSRTAQAATITIVDNVTRALPRVIFWVDRLKKTRKKDLENLLSTWDNTKNLRQVMVFLSKRLNSL